MYPLVFLWILWCAIHSLLINQTISSHIKRLLGRFSGLYRIFYILFSILSLIPVVIYQHSLPETILFTWTGSGKILQISLIFYAIALFYLGLQAYDMSFFLGISQWQDTKNNKVTKPAPFKTEGILCQVRHPWYSGAFAFLWGFDSITNISLVANLILSAYLIIAALLEEKRLKHEIGAPYVSYCKKVPMLIPWKLSKGFKGKSK